jgi:hypothetical protein
MWKEGYGIKVQQTINKRFNEKPVGSTIPQRRVKMPTKDNISDDISEASSPPPIPPELIIPNKIQEQLLPDHKLSILEFLEFPLPTISIGHPDSHLPSSFFSKKFPTVTDHNVIQTIPTPSLVTVKALGQAYKDVSGFKSIACPHLKKTAAERYLPLWVITYWMEVIELRLTWREPWVHAEKDLRSRDRGWKDGQSKTLIAEVHDALSTLPWHGQVQGFDNEEPIYTLATYATRAWFTDVHVNQILDLLRHTLNLDPTKSKFEVENLHFYRTLEAAYKDRDGGRYENARYFARPRGLGQALATGERDFGVFEANICGNHWVAIIVDFRGSKILYGDPMGDPPDANILAVFRWWTHHHTGTKFTNGTFDITKQADGYSCGILSLNGAAHFCAPERFPLLDPKRVDDGRLKVLLQVARRHHDHQVMLLIYTPWFRLTDIAI